MIDSDASTELASDRDRDRDRDSRHRKRMERKKALVDDKIKQADQERGIIILLKGNGKGKNSSAFGMGARLYPAA